MLKAQVRRLKITEIIVNHVILNIRAYIITSLIFIVGIFLGVMLVNNIQQESKEEISNYINNYVEKVKENKNVLEENTLRKTIKDNIILAVGLWFAGTTLIGIPIVFGVILFKGFCLGYTISACIYTMGLTKGMFFIITSIFIQNILIIPAILALGVSGLNLYKSIMKDRRKENIKLKIAKHTVFSIIILIILVISAIVKINISGRLLENLIKYF